MAKMILSPITGMLEEWCKANSAALAAYPGLVVAVHPVHGVVASVSDLPRLGHHLRFMKRAIRYEVDLIEAVPC